MRQRKDFTRREGEISPRLIVIAAEGKDTENIYFEAMKSRLCASNVQVEVLKRGDNNSSPENVYSQIDDFKKEYNIEDDDELWVVIDRDRWTEKMLSFVAQHCYSDSNLRFCVSNPCFELWLLLHLEDVAEYSDEDRKGLAENRKTNDVTWLKRKMKDITGHYTESNYDAYELLKSIEDAITRARKST